MVVGYTKILISPKQKDSHNKNDSKHRKGKPNNTLSPNFGINNQRDYSSIFERLGTEEEEDMILNHSVNINHQRLTNRSKNLTPFHNKGSDST